MKKTIKNALLTTAGAASILAGVSVAADASTVKSIKGDTVWDFAQKNHTTVDAIVKANHLSDANMIYVDQELTIPDGNDNAASQDSQAPASAAPAVDDKGDYTVVAGDTLSKVSEKTGVSVADLASINGLSDANFLLVGQVLHTKGQASAAPASAASAAPAPSQAPAASNNDTPAPSQATAPATDAASAGIAGFNSGVDGYPAGQCTAFVAGILRAQGVSKATYAFLGNGNAWGANAGARGVAVNQTPSAGSVAYFGYMHVAYVTGVNGDGSVNIIEGNYAPGVAYHARTISAGEAAGYIHF